MRGVTEAGWMSTEQHASLRDVLVGLSMEDVRPTPLMVARWAHVIGSEPRVILFIDEIGKLRTTQRVRTLQRAAHEPLSLETRPCR